MTEGYSTAPQCVPSRGGLLTGQYQNRFGLEVTPIEERIDRLEKAVFGNVKNRPVTTGRNP